MLTRFVLTVSGIILCNSCTEPGAKVCTEIGCTNGFVASLNHPSWAAGTYRFDIQIDGEKFTCLTSLPFASCNLPQPCDSDKVRIGLSGCALPSSNHSVSDIGTSLVNFSEMKLKITRNTEILLDKSLRPTFKTSQPNGPGCEPVCRNANESVQF